MRRDIANDAVEFDRDSPLDVAIVKAWDADCRSRHGFAILKRCHSQRIGRLMSATQELLAELS